jgi:hypothetical protein
VANEKHVEMLRAGVVWNDCRNQNPEVIHPNLSAADLSGADLSETNLSGADLRLAYLTEADQLLPIGLCMISRGRSLAGRLQLGYP